MAKVEVVSSSVGRTADGCELRIRSPWYRSLPLSSIDIELEVDGKAVAQERMRFNVNDRDYALTELADEYESTWFVLDPGRLRVGGVEPGEHAINLNLSLRIPYLFDEETGAVHAVRTRVEKTIEVPVEAVA